MSDCSASDSYTPAPAKGPGCGPLRHHGKELSRGVVSSAQRRLVRHGPGEGATSCSSPCLPVCSASTPQQSTRANGEGTFGFQCFDKHRKDTHRAPILTIVGENRGHLCLFVRECPQKKETRGGRCREGATCRFGWFSPLRCDSNTFSPCGDIFFPTSD